MLTLTLHSQLDSILTFNNTKASFFKKCSESIFEYWGENTQISHFHRLMSVFQTVLTRGKKNRGFVS